MVRISFGSPATFWRALRRLTFIGSCAGCHTDSSQPPPPQVPALQFSAPARVETYTCARLTVAAVDGMDQPVAVSANTQIALSGLGSAQTFATLADCQTGPAMATLMLAPSQTGASVDFYLRASATESLTLSASAAGFTSGSVNLTTLLFQVLGEPDVKVSANVILGQNAPTVVTVAHGKLFIADRLSHRVLIWNSLPGSSGTAPDLVLGQPDKSSRNANFGTGVAHSATASNMNQPIGVAYDGVRLFVADSGNHRILSWTTFPTTDGQPASFALGQPGGPANLTSNTVNNGGVSGAGLATPRGLFTDGTRLFIADHDNHRVLVWNNLPDSPSPLTSLLANLGGTTT